jgi:hypothetical protein
MIDIRIGISAIKGTLAVELREIIRNRQVLPILLFIGRVYLEKYKVVILNSGKKCNFLI